MNALAISIILPCFNAEVTILKCLRSLAAQTHTHFECIAIDDGSTDSTLKILQEFADADPRFSVISRPNRGLIYTLNEGISLSKGEWIARMDADDLAHPSRLELQIQYAKEHNLDIVGSAAIYFGAKSYKARYVSVPPEIMPYMLAMQNTLFHPSVLMRKQVFNKVVKYDATANLVEDYELWCRLSRLGARIGNQPNALLGYRLHGDQITSKNRYDMNLQFLQVRNKHIREIVQEERISTLSICCIESTSPTQFRTAFKELNGCSTENLILKEKKNSIVRAIRIYHLNPKTIASIGIRSWTLIVFMTLLSKDFPQIIHELNFIFKTIYSHISKEAGWIRSLK